jgi:hypothetical protein
MSQWSEMVERQQREKWDTLRQQLKDNQDVLRKLMEGVQATQMKQLEAKHERYESRATLSLYADFHELILCVLHT